MSSRLRDFVESESSSAEVERLWSGVATQLDRRRRERVLLGALAAAAFAGLVVLAFLGGQWLSPRRETAALERQVLRLADGSEVELTPSARFEVEHVSAERVELRLDRGEGLFRVSKVPSRVFVVRAGGHLIRVLGTTYRVTVDGERVSVAVDEGAVGVSRLDGSEFATVRAGEVWSMSRVPDTAPARIEPPPPVPPSHVGAGAANSNAPEPALEPSAEASSASPKEPAPADAARRLFDRAQERRLAGDDKEAARLLALLLEKHPRDPRAKLAALELGRLRLGAGDPKGALDPLDKAKGASDAADEAVLARRIEALDASGDWTKCAAEKAEFLRRFAKGPFAAAVRARCTKR